MSREGIRDESGRRPAYGLCVILARYILCCPDRIYHDPQWVAFRDFKKDAAITNVNYFTSDVEQAVLGHFQGRPDGLERACRNLGGIPHVTGAGYDVSMAIDLLPRIRLLVLFNDKDEDFPALCRVLSQKHSEFYLDPESLAMSGTSLAKQLIRADREIEARAATFQGASSLRDANTCRVATAFPGGAMGTELKSADTLSFWRFPPLFLQTYLYRSQLEYLFVGHRCSCG